MLRRTTYFKAFTEAISCPRHPHQSKQATCFSTTAVRNFFDKERLAGTVPHHLAYVLLHHPRPPIDYPPKIDKAFSPLYRALLLAAVQRGASVNFCWRDDFRHKETKGQTSDDEAYAATIFSSKIRERRIELPNVSFSNLSIVEKILDDPVGYLDRSNGGINEDAEVHLYVCTHGSRDCRCGEKGGRLVSALRAELSKRQAQPVDSKGSEGDSANYNVWSRIRIGEIAHVGGHKYAGNVLIFPFGDWLGLLDAEHAPKVLDSVSERLATLQSQSSFLSLPPIMPEHWRGRMGLVKNEQPALVSN